MPLKLWPFDGDSSCSGKSIKMKRSFLSLFCAISCAKTKLRSLSPQNTLVMPSEPINFHLNPLYQYCMRLPKHNTANKVLIVNADAWMKAKQNI